MASTISSERSCANAAAAYLMIEVAALGPFDARDSAAMRAVVRPKAWKSILFLVMRERRSASASAPVFIDAPHITLGDLAEIARRPPRAAAPPKSPRDVLPLVQQEALGDRPAAVQLADHVLLGNLHVGEEGLAERALAGDQLDRPRLDAARGHVDQHEGDALVLLGLVGAHQAETPVGAVGVRGSRIFWPLISQWSPLSSHRVCRPARSDPAPGSE